LDIEDDAVVLQKAKDDIVSITNKDGDLSSATLYLLIKAEALAADGVVAKSKLQEQVDHILNMRATIKGSGQFDFGGELGKVINNFGYSETQFIQILGEYITTVLYVNQVTARTDIDKAEAAEQAKIAKLVGGGLDSKESGLLEGNYVTFNSASFAHKIDPPSDELIQAHFDQYKSVAPIVTDENEFGFGYKLPDRVKLEYLRVDAKVVENTVVKPELENMDVVAREELLVNYWQENKKSYQVTPKPAPDATPDIPAPAPFDPPFDEVVGRVETDYIKTRASEMVQDVVNKLDDTINAAINAKQADETKTIDVAQLAEAASVDKIKVVSNIIGFITEEALGSDSQFRNVSRPGAPGQTAESFAETVFNCEELHVGLVSRYENSPIAIGEIVGPLWSQVQGEKQVAIFVRVLGSDKSRDASALDDDGSKGAYVAGAVKQSVCKTFTTAKRDLTTKLTYDVVLASANTFTGQATDDWAASVLAMNVSLADENDKDNKNETPTGPLSSADLEKMHTVIAGLRAQYKQYGGGQGQNQGLENYFYSQLSAPMTLLYNVAQGYVDAGDNKKLVIVEQPASKDVLVFEAITLLNGVEPTVEALEVNQKQIERAMEITLQLPVLLSWLNPKEVVSRMSYIDIEDEDE
jgi:hypothetical protein